VQQPRGPEFAPVLLVPAGLFPKNLQRLVHVHLHLPEHPAGFGIEYLAQHLIQGLLSVIELSFRFLSWDFKHGMGSVGTGEDHMSNQTACCESVVTY